jgi:MSHA biogenesis protein MshI
VLSLLRPRIANTRVGLEFRADGLAIAVARPARYLNLKHVECFWLPSLPNKRIVNLSQAIDRLGLKGCNCDIVLPRNEYQRLEIDKPNVPDDELTGAARWAVRKVLDQPDSDFQVEYFDYPEQALRGRPPRINVRVVQQDSLNTALQSAKAAGLKPVRVTVSDLAVKNLMQQVLESQDLQLLVKYEKGYGLILIQKGGVLYFCRDFYLQKRSNPGSEEALQTLAIEIQRSIDYFEGQTGIATPKLIHCLSDLAAERQTALSSLLGYSIRPFPYQGNLGELDSLSDASSGALLSVQSALASLCVSQGEGVS